MSSRIGPFTRSKNGPPHRDDRVVRRFAEHRKYRSPQRNEGDGEKEDVLPQERALAGDE